MANAKEAIKRIAQEAKAQRGWQVWIMGGPVRDFFMGRDNHDIDCVIEGPVSGEEIVGWIKQFTNDVKITGQRFGVVKAKIDGHEFDFVPPRRESKIAPGKAGFAVEFDNVSMAEDMARRDFTFNAAAIKADTGEIFDPFDAKGAIERKEISPVSEAFCEDANRIRRGARFAARFGFKATGAMIEMAQKVRQEFEIIAPNAVWAEFQKWASDKNEAPGQFWAFFRDIGFEEFFPEISDWDAIINECDKIKWMFAPDEIEDDGDKRREVEARCVAMFAAIARSGANAQAMMKRFGCGKSFRGKVANFDKPEPVMSGQEIMAIFPNRKPGAWIREMQNQMAGMSKDEANEWAKAQA